jgi:hypothetical protein
MGNAEVKREKCGMRSVGNVGGRVWQAWETWEVNRGRRGKCGRWSVEGVEYPVSQGRKQVMAT